MFLDEWQTPFSISNYLAYHDIGVTYRAFGISKNIWVENDDWIHTNTEVFDGAGNQSQKHVNITTNKKNSANIYCAYSQNNVEHQKIILQQIEP